MTIKKHFTRFAAGLPLLLASCLPGIAHAGYYGQTITADFTGFANVYPFDFGSATIGDGVEFVHTVSDQFGQVWTFSLDVTNDSAIVSWTEQTRPNNEGNISTGTPDGFGFNLAFSAPLAPLALSAAQFSGAPNQSGLSNIDYRAPNAVHFGFSKLESGEAYAFAAAVPEPATYAMLLAGLGLVGAAARRRKAG